VKENNLVLSKTFFVKCFY